MRLITLICDNGAGEMTFLVDHIVAVSPHERGRAIILVSTNMHYFPYQIVDRVGGCRRSISYKQLCEALEQMQ